MKISAQEEYGLRIMLTIARDQSDDGMTINQISERENLSMHNVAKMLRILRLAGFVKSTRGQNGGYQLGQAAGEILISDLMETLGGRLFNEKFCANHSGLSKLCTNSVDCSLRSLWRVMQYALDQVLDKLTLQDLIGEEGSFEDLVMSKIQSEQIEI